MSTDRGVPPRFQQAADTLYVELAEDSGLSFPDFIQLVRENAKGAEIDWTAVREAFLFGRGRHFPIAFRNESSQLREKAKVRFSPDGLSAYLIFYPPKPRGRRMEEAEVHDLIAAYGVSEELLFHREIQSALNRREYGEPLLIARGRAPVHPPPVSLEWSQPTIPTDPEGFCQALPRLSSLPKSVLIPVKEGDVAARRAITASGAPGLTARGQVLPPKPVVDPNVYGGGLQVSGTRRELVTAKASGHLRVVGVRGAPGAYAVSVIPGREIHDPQELLEAAEHGFFVGSLIYVGDLEVSFPLYVLGNLEVRGSLVQTKTRVAGSLFVRDGIIHNERHPVLCSGLVSAGFYDRASVAAHTIHVHRHSLHSQLSALDTVAGARGSSLMGGSVEAGRRIEADVIGAQQSSSTRVAIGNAARDTLLPALRNWREQLKHQFEEGPPLPETLEDEVTNLKASIGENLSPQEGRIAARTVFSGVTVCFDALSRDITDTHSGVVFTYERLGDKDRIAMSRS